MAAPAGTAAAAAGGATVDLVLPPIDTRYGHDDEEAQHHRHHQQHQQQQPDQQQLASPTTLSSMENYTAETIRSEFHRIHTYLPPPDELLQLHHSVDALRTMIVERSGIGGGSGGVGGSGCVGGGGSGGGSSSSGGAVGSSSSGSEVNTNIIPRFLRRDDDEEGGVKPHNALCCLLLDDYERTLRNAGVEDEGVGDDGSSTNNNEAANNNASANNASNNNKAKARTKTAKKLSSCEDIISSSLVRVLSLGYLHRQLILPAEFIRDQFYRVAHVIPTRTTTTTTHHHHHHSVPAPVPPHVLRHKIRDSGLPVPNYFLDPENNKQFPPHIAMLVVLQEDEQESRYLRSNVHRLAWLLFAFVALLLRLILEVIGGAGAIWGGSEVFRLRDPNTPGSNELWRWLSVGVGVCCFLRFVTLNAPQEEDEGDILGPAGPWSLRTAARLRAVCEHPFHYFARAQPPFCPGNDGDGNRKKRRQSRRKNL